MKVIIAALLLALLSISTNARTIRWTGLGGTPLWDFDRNWDCSCVPTIADDVIIDLPNTPGQVKIGSDATCNSVTVGGTSSFPQSLYIQGAFNVGQGGGVINPNGEVTLDSSPVTPLSCDGVFSGSTHFVFRSGTLAGKGQFNFASLNLTSPALKQINATTVVKGNLWVLPGSGQQALINVAQTSLQVSGTLITEEALTVFSDDTQGASFDVTGTLNFNGGGSKQLILRGYASIAVLNINSGQLVIQNTVDIAGLFIAAGASASAIGGPDNKRNIGKVSGPGLLTIQGGSNVIKAASQLGSLQLVSGVVNSDGSLVVGTFGLVGGSLSGKAQIGASIASLSNGVFTDATLTAGNLDFGGYVTLSGSTVIVTSSGTFSADSQFTMGGGAQFTVAAGAKVSQTKAFQLVPAGDNVAPLFSNDGYWSSTTTTSINVDTIGKGTWDYQGQSTLSATGVSFATSVANVGSSWKFLGATVDIASLSGTGDVEINGKIVIINSISLGKFSLLNGQVQIDGGSVGVLSVSNGQLAVTKSLNITELDFTAGTITGAQDTGASLSIASSLISGGAPKFLTNIHAVSHAITWDCAGGSCQLVNNNALFTTVASE